MNYKAGQLYEIYFNTGERAISIVTSTGDEGHMKDIYSSQNRLVDRWTIEVNYDDITSIKLLPDNFKEENPELFI